MSRTAAIEVSRKLIGSYKNTAEIKDFLRRINLKAIGLPDIVINEIRKFVIQ